MLARSRYTEPLAKAALIGTVLTLSVLRASEIEVVPISPFAHLLKGCSVTGFTVDDAGSVPARDLKDHFEGLRGRDIPYGNYKLVVLCGTRHLSRRITIDRDRQVETFEQYVGIIYEGAGPSLVIGMDRRRGSDDALYWVQVVGVYNNVRYAAEVSRQTGEGEIRVPPTGSYVVVALSTGGYQCAIEVDLVQFTRHWVFHQDTCSLDVDRFAHVVTRSDKLNHRQGGWYSEMEKEKEELFREMREAAEKTGEEASGKP